MKMVVFKYGEPQNIGAVRRYFAAKFFPKHPRKVPACKAFKRVIDRFHLTGNVKKQPKVGRQQGPEENTDRVKVFFEKNEDACVRKAAQELGLGYGTVLRIKKKLCWKPYRTHRAPALSPAHIETRLSACNFFLQFQEEWFDRVIYTDEKMLVLLQELHQQNDCTWAPGANFFFICHTI